MKIKKSCLPLFLALTLIFGLAAGCGTDGTSVAESGAILSEAATVGIESAAAPAESVAEHSDPNTGQIEDAQSPIYPLSQELVTITYWGPDQSSSNSALPTYGNIDAYDIWGYVESVTGVHLDLTVVSRSMENEQLNLMLVAGDYTDIMGINASMVSGGLSYLLNENIITDLVGYVQDYMPNYYSFICQSEEKLKLSYDDDGHLYGTRAFAEYYVPNQGLVVREDLVKELNLEMPTTIDGLHEVLTAFKTEFGMDSPLWMGTGGQNGKHIVGAMGSIGFPADFGSISDHIYQKDGVVGSGLLDDGYLDYLKLMNQWYNEGLFLSDFATQTDMEASNTYVLNGETGVFSAMYGQALAVQNSLQSINESAALYAIPTPVKNAGDENPYFNFSPLPNSSWCTVSSSCSEFLLTLRYMDWWFTDDGYYTANYGVEGLSYKFDNNGKPYYTELITDNEWGIDAASAIEAYVLNNPVIGVVAMDRSVYLVGEDWVTEMLDIWVEQANDSCSLPTGVTLTTQESEAISSIIGDTATYATENILKFISGDKDFSEWESYKAGLMNLGLQDVIDTYQAAYNRYIAR